MSARLLRLALLLPWAIAAGCAGGGRAPSPQVVAAGGVRICGAWARSSPSMSSLGAAYLALESEQPDTLLGAELPDSVAAGVELHEVVGGPGGEMRMQRVDAIAIAPGAAIQLRPGKFHLMLVGLRRPLVAGDTLRMRLRFRNAGWVALPVPVRPL